MEEVFREKDKGVSAIVGTILIVAITVVLAATVYGVLTGFGGLISGGAPTGAISVTSNANTYTVTFTQLSKNMSTSIVQVKVTNSTGTDILTLGGTAGTNTGYKATISPTAGPVSISAVITVSGGSVALTSIAIVCTSPSGTVASWSS